jgi:hypothetical protein
MTQLNLQQIEVRPDSNRPFEIQIVKGEKYRGKRIVVDNHQFEQCHFENCNFVFSGGHFAFAECTLEGSCAFSPTGAAYKTMNLYRSLLPQIEKSRPPY